MNIIKASNVTKELIENSSRIFYSSPIIHYLSGTWDSINYVFIPVNHGKRGWATYIIMTSDPDKDDGEDRLNDMIRKYKWSHDLTGVLVPYFYDYLNCEPYLVTDDELLEWLTKDKITEEDGRQEYKDYGVEFNYADGYVSFDLNEGLGYNPVTHSIDTIERKEDISEIPDDYNPFEYARDAANQQDCYLNGYDPDTYNEDGGFEN